MQRLLGINGVIVDFVKEIANAVSDMNQTFEEGKEEELFLLGKKISDIDVVLK